MKKPQALPIFGDAYLADTTHLTTEEHGAYLLLMLAAWRQDDCHLPSDDRKLARITGLSLRKWNAMKPVILEFWQVSGDRIFQARLLKEWHFVRQKSEQNRKTAEGRWKGQGADLFESEQCERICEGNAPPPPPISSSEDIYTREKPSPKRSSKWSTIPRPDGVASDIWQDFERHRKAKAAPITETAIRGFEREAAKAGLSLEGAITESIERNWQGFKADWIKGSGNGNGNRNNAGSGNGLLDAAIDEMRQTGRYERE